MLRRQRPQASGTPWLSVLTLPASSLQGCPFQGRKTHLEGAHEVHSRGGLAGLTDEGASQGPCHSTSQEEPGKPPPAVKWQER